MSTGKPKLSARDLEIAGVIWQCFKAEPQVDFDKLANLGGWKNANTARVQWLPIKKRLMAQASGGGVANITTPKSTGKRKEADTADGETPSKKPRAKATKRENVPARGESPGIRDGNNGAGRTTDIDNAVDARSMGAEESFLNPLDMGEA